MERVASGLRKELSLRDVFMYDSLTISFFSMMWFLLFLYQPVVFSGGSITLGLALLLLVSLPFFYSYARLSKRLPLSGGDYVFQSRYLGPGVGFVSTFTGWVVWQLFFIAWFGYYITDVILIPLIYYFGRLMGVQSPLIGGLTAGAFVFVLTVALFLVAFYITLRGMGAYARIQPFLFAFMIAAGASVILMLFLSPGESARQLSQPGPVNVFNSIGTWAISWGALGYGMWSVLSNEEISNVKNHRGYFAAMAGAALLNVAFIVALWKGLLYRFGYAVIQGLAQSWSSGSLSGLYSTIGAPYYSAMLVTISPNPVLYLIFAIGAILAMFQVIIAILIGASRVMLSQSLDGILPKSLSIVREDFNSPIYSLLLALAISVVWIYLIVFVPWIGPFFVSVVFSVQLTWILTMAASVVYGVKEKDRGALAGGVAGLALNAFIAALYVIYPGLGFLSKTSELVVAGVLAIAAAYYVIADLLHYRRFGITIERKIRALSED